MFGLSWIRYLKLSELLKNYKIIANEPAKLKGVRGHAYPGVFEN